MKRKSAVSLGPGAPSLILIFVVLSMSVLGMLALMSARNDRSLSLRSAEVTETVYGLNARAEETARTLDLLVRDCAGQAESREELYSMLEGRLPAEGMTWTVAAPAEEASGADADEPQKAEDEAGGTGSIPDGLIGTISWQEQEGERTLECTVTVAMENGAVRMQWLRHRLVTELGSTDWEDEWN